MTVLQATATCPSCQHGLHLINAAPPAPQSTISILGCHGCEMQWEAHLTLIEHGRVHGDRFRPTTKATRT